jgi:hypothetical protein
MARETLFQHLMFKVEILCTQHVGQGGWEVRGTAISTIVK